VATATAALRSLNEWLDSADGARELLTAVGIGDGPVGRTLARAFHAVADLTTDGGAPFDTLLDLIAMGEDDALDTLLRADGFSTLRDVLGTLRAAGALAVNGEGDLVAESVLRRAFALAGAGLPVQAGGRK
jgi:hypothetical protein